MIIKNKEIINTGTKLFNDVHRFKYACSDYFKFKYRGYEDDAIQDFLDLSKPQQMFLSRLWSDPKYSESYKNNPWVIIETNVARYLEGDRCEQIVDKITNPVQEKFKSFEEFRAKFTDFMYLRFQSKTLSEIQDSINLSDDQAMLLLRVFNDLSKKIISNLEYLFYNVFNDLSKKIISNLEYLFYNGV